MFFEYNVLIIFKEFTNEYGKKTFHIYAKDEENARKIATEILYLTNGNPNNELQISVKRLMPKKDLQKKILSETEHLLLELQDIFMDQDYSFYVENFIKYGGHNAKFDRQHKIKEYICSYKDIDVRILYDFINNTCVIDRDYAIYFNSTTPYFVTENCTKVLNCKL